MQEILSTQHFFDPATSTLSYIIWDQETHDCIILDPVLDYDPLSSKVSLNSIQLLKYFISQNNLNPRLIIDTHCHADHLTGAYFLRKEFKNLPYGIGKRIKEVQNTFAKIFEFSPNEFSSHDFDLYFEDQKEYQFGSLTFKAIATPGHTPACTCYYFEKEELLFTGDSMFMPDYGTGRCDFPGGSAETLYQSIQKRIYSLPASTRIFTGHDYQPNGRALKFESTVQEEKIANTHLNEKTTLEEYTKFRKERDATLTQPRLLFPSIQINIFGGRIPSNFLKIPISF